MRVVEGVLRGWRVGGVRERRAKGAKGVKGVKGAKGAKGARRGLTRVWGYFVLVRVARAPAYRVNSSLHA